MHLYYSHSRLLQEASGNHFSPLSPEPHDDPCEATAYDIAASNLPLPASSCRHPPPPAPLSSCRCPLPQKGEFNSQCGNWCGSDIVLKCFGAILDARRRRRRRRRSPLQFVRASISINLCLSVYADIFFPNIRSSPPPSPPLPH